MPATQNLISDYNTLRYSSYAVNPVYRDIFNLTDNKNVKNKNNSKLILNNKIILDNISFSYPNEKNNVINNISITIDKGSSVGIVGFSGSGKTSLVDIILGLLQPKEGNIFIDDINIKSNIKKWQANIGYIPQSIYLSDATIKDNITFGLSKVWQFMSKSFFFYKK